MGHGFGAQRPSTTVDVPNHPLVDAAECITVVHECVGIRYIHDLHSFGVSDASVSIT